MNKVEYHLRSVQSSLNKKNHVFEPVSNANVKHSVINVNSELICATCNECMFDAIQDLCVLDYVNDVNVRIQSKSVKSKKKKDWKPTGKVFTNVGYSWKPIGRTFTINGSTCPLTRINSTTVVPPMEPTSIKVVKKTLPSFNNSGKLKDITNIGRSNRPLVSGLGLLQAHDKEPLLAHQLWKSKKYTHKPKSNDSIQEKLYLLHMDLCGPMRIESISGKKYILVIVDDYSRFTWVKFLRSKDETPEIMIKLLKKIQFRLNATFHNIRTDNGTKIMNQTLQAYYDDVDIIHQTSVASTP
ncbi:retrovirus-related pol polyprotein from transposon TNT 1-94 [Tanacetum coccineum]